MIMREINNPPDPVRAITGFRDTGYNLYTAVADLVDNSINAKADNVWINIWKDEGGEVHARIIDDGYGMDEDELIDAMKYGSSEKEDGNELGKFGLGLKTASTSVCKHLIVISRKDPNGNTYQASWDIDRLGTTDNEYPLMIGEAEPKFKEEFDDIINNTGTIVCWEKIDRLGGESDLLVNEIRATTLGQYKKNLKEHLSMVFHKFMENGSLNIYFHDEKLEPWNPFVPAEDTWRPIDNEIEIIDSPQGSGTIELKACIIPSKYEYSTEEARLNATVSNSKQGLYVYREDRMVVYHDWLGLYHKEPHYSLARVEINFKSELDEFFGLNILKTNFNIEPLKEPLRKLLSPYREQANQRYRHGRTRKAKESINNPHDASQKLLSDKYLDNTSEVIVNKIAEGKVEVENKMGKTIIRVPTLDPDFSNQLVKTEQTVNDGLFWSPVLIKSRIGVVLNESHPYYERVYMPNFDDSVMVRGLDSLLWALAVCEQEVINEEAKKRFKDFRFAVSRTLRELAEELPEYQDDND